MPQDTVSIESSKFAKPIAEGWRKRRTQMENHFDV